MIQDVTKCNNMIQDDTRCYKVRQNITRIKKMFEINRKCKIGLIEMSLVKTVYN